MHKFECEECGTTIIKAASGLYKTTCKHYPISEHREYTQDAYNRGDSRINRINTERQRRALNSDRANHRGFFRE